MDTPAEIKPEEKAFVDTCREWFQGDNERKASLYTTKRTLRPIYAYLSTLSDGFALFEHIPKYLWPGFVDFKPDILCRDWSPELQAVFQGLPADIAYKGLSSLRSKPYTLKQILHGFHPDLQTLVVKMEMERFEKSLKRHESGISIITSAKLFSDYPSLRSCEATKCLSLFSLRGFDDYILIKVADCYKHSFHLACSSQHSCDGVLPKIEAKQS
jgi:hypothetical protein